MEIALYEAFKSENYRMGQEEVGVGSRRLTKPDHRLRKSY
jgi:hypothetical protein